MSGMGRIRRRRSTSARRPSRSTRSRKPNHDDHRAFLFRGHDGIGHGLCCRHFFRSPEQTQETPPVTIADKKKTPIDDWPMERDAVISDSKVFRYQLTRIWDRTRPKLMIVGLNCS